MTRYNFNDRGDPIETETQKDTKVVGKKVYHDGPAGGLYGEDLLEAATAAIAAFVTLSTLLREERGFPSMLKEEEVAWANSKGREFMRKAGIRSMEASKALAHADHNPVKDALRLIMELNP